MVITGFIDSGRRFALGSYQSGVLGVECASVLIVEQLEWSDLVDRATTLWHTLLPILNPSISNK